MINLYCEHFDNWRLFLAEYHQEEMKLAKKQITKLFYGGVPNSDLPFMWKLKQEVDHAITYILQLEEANLLNQAFHDRSNPKYSRFSYFMANLEN